MLRAIFAPILAALLLLSTSFAPLQAAATCTLVLGFSQTNQWYTGGFESYVSSGAWELQWNGGASIDHFVDPADPVWTSTIVSPCVAGASSPDRAVLNVSGDYSSDVPGWASRASAAAANIRTKYPTVAQIVLQPVVGGPGYGQCMFGGNVVRASYNAPYIAAAIDSLVGGDISAGPHPTVTSCSHFADDIGHLTDASVFDYVAHQVADFYNATGPTPTPTATSLATATPTPLATLTPTPVPATTIVDFNALTPYNRVLSGQSPAGVISWGTNLWYLSGPYGQFSTNSIGFNGAGPTSAAFSFVTPHRLLRIDAFNGGPASSTVSLACAGQPTVTSSLLANHQVQLAPSWTAACSPVTVGSSNGWDTNFDNLVFDDGTPATPTPTPVPPTPTSTSSPTATPSPSPTATPIPPTPTAEPTATPTDPTPTATETPVPTLVCEVFVRRDTSSAGEWMAWDGCAAP